jgi:3-phosphoinositide dependent protein kinase-1
MESEEEKCFDSEEDDEDDDPITKSRARTESFVGTVNYLSPEVINNAPQTYAIDIWAMGNIFFKMMTGSVPFKGTNPKVVYTDIMNRNIHWP